jgi:hypothetical protein
MSNVYDHTIHKTKKTERKEIIMYLSVSPIKQSIPFPGTYAITCPYDQSGTGISCAASIMTVTTNGFQKRNYCWTDNYDCCPLFLAKVLRGN